MSSDMRHPFKTILLALMMASSSSSYAIAAPGIMNLSALVYPRAPTANAQLAKMPLPYTLAEDQKGTQSSLRIFLESLQNYRSIGG
ncbi:hypothetical protein WDW86_18960 [Bdellovibrionota bacterium FG-2]